MLITNCTDTPPGNSPVFMAAISPHPWPIQAKSLSTAVLHYSTYNAGLALQHIQRIKRIEGTEYIDVAERLQARPSSI